MLPLSPKSCLISFPVNCLFTEKWRLSVGTTVQWLVDGRCVVFHDGRCGSFEIVANPDL
jgi:hypothetical protein